MILSHEEIIAIKSGNHFVLSRGLKRFFDYRDSNFSEQKITEGYLRKWSYVLKESIDDLRSIAAFEFWEAVKNYKFNGAPFDAYVFICLKNKFVNLHKERRREKRAVEVVSFGDWMEIETYTPDEKKYIYLKKRLQEIARENQLLKPDIKKLIDLLLKGYDEVKVIAEMMDCSGSYIRNLLIKLRSFL